MSEKEQILQRLEKVPAYKMKYVLSYLDGLLADEEEDDAFCMAMYEKYLADPDPDKDETISLEEAAKLCGVDLHDLSD